jgi:exopolysaccharide biosynthesis predicted pyruvyltransferase EpsI
LKSIIKRTMAFIVLSVIFITFENMVSQNDVFLKWKRVSSLTKNDDKRIECIENIKWELKKQFSSLIRLNQKQVHLLDIPLYDNYGDTLIW